MLGQYVRALVLLALITFVVWSGVFLAAGVPYALVLAAIGGALEFIPVIGPLAAGVVARTTGPAPSSWGAASRSIPRW